MQLLRLLTALMLLFGLIYGSYGQNRGTAKFNSPQEHNSFSLNDDNIQHETDKTSRNNRVREINGGANVNVHRKSRYRSKESVEVDGKLRDEEILPRNHKISSTDDSFPKIRRRPVRVGRRRLTTPIPTTEIPSSEIPMVIPKKVYQETTQDPISFDKVTKTIIDNQQLVTTRMTTQDLNQDLSQNETRNETSEKPVNFRIRHFTRTPVAINQTASSFVSTTTEPNRNNFSTRSSYRKSSRYQATASDKVESISTESTTQRISSTTQRISSTTQRISSTTQRIIRRPIIRSTEKIQNDLPTTPLPPPLSRGTARSIKRYSAKQKPDILEDLEDENYPEHFKMLLKANYQSNLSTTVPDTNKAPKFKNFKTRRVVSYRGYKQGLSSSTIPSTANESNLKVTFPRIYQNNKLLRNVSIETNDVLVNDLDATKEDFILVKETNYPEGTTIPGRFSTQIKQKEKPIEVTTFKPKISKLLTRNKLFKQRVNTVGADLNSAQIPENKVPLPIGDISPPSLQRYSARYRSDNNFKSNSGSKSGASNPIYIPTIPPRTTDSTASSIIDLLKNYNQTDTQLKTQNIFSLAPTSPAQINNMREKYLTLDIDPVTNQVRDPNDLENYDNLDGSVYRWKPISSTPETSRGVEIIKYLVEQAKTTEEIISTGAVQSLTTSKNKQAGRGFDAVTTAQTSTSTQETQSNVPYNIKNDSNTESNDDNVGLSELTTNITPFVILADPITDQAITNIETTYTIPSQPVTSIKTTLPSSTTLPLSTPLPPSTTLPTSTISAPTTTTSTTMRNNENTMKASNEIRQITTTNRPVTSKNPSTSTQEQSTLQRNLLLLQELLGLTENGARGFNDSLRPSTVLMRRPTTTSTTSTTSLAPRRRTTSTTTPQPTTTTTTPQPTTTTTTTTTTPRPTTTTTVTTSSVRPSVQFNSIDDILNSLQTSRPTTQKPRTTTPSEVDDLTFINRLRFLLNPSLTTRKPPTRATTTIRTTTTTTTTTPKPTTPTTLPSNINDLFASFGELTTKKQATFSDSDDIAFLAGLRQIAQLDQPKQTSTQDPDFANKIIQLAINRTGKSSNANKLPSEEPTSNNLLHPNSIQTEPPVLKPSLSKTEIERGKEDIETINSDLKLLSTLLGRPISPNDLPQLTQQFGGGASEGPKKRYPSSTSTTSTTSSTTTQKPAIVKEVELLQSLLRSPTKDIKSPVGSDEYYGNTDEAILATILKQKGIGPSHNNIPIEQLLGQNNNYYQTTRTTTTTTRRPRPRPPPRQSRPILDGLSWLWRTWQDTAPGPQATKTRAQNPREVSNSPIRQQTYDDGTDGDTYTKPLDSSEESFSPIAPAGGGLLSAAIGVTRAVTQFLGAALQGAGRSIQSAWTSQPQSSSAADNNYYRLSG